MLNEIDNPMEMNLDLNLFFKPESTTEILEDILDLRTLHLSKDWYNDPRDGNGEVPY
jgi:hypothetical protein